MNYIFSAEFINLIKRVGVWINDIGAVISLGGGNKTKENCCYNSIKLKEKLKPILLKLQTVQKKCCQIHLTERHSHDNKTRYGQKEKRKTQTNPNEHI